jgi:hypothetical protein
MANPWFTALKTYNDQKGGSWCVPKKGSAEYEKVKSLMTPAKKIIDNTQVNPKMASRSQLKSQPGLKPAVGVVQKNKNKGVSSLRKLLDTGFSKPVIAKNKAGTKSAEDVFRNLMSRFNIAENPKRSFVPGKLKKLFLDVVAALGKKYNVENKLIELLEERGPKLALSYDRDIVPPGFKEATIEMA